MGSVRGERRERPRVRGRRAGSEHDPRSYAAGLLRRSLAALPQRARQGRVRLRVDAGYFAGELARVAFLEGVEFAIGAKRIAPLWRLLDGRGRLDRRDRHDRRPGRRRGLPAGLVARRHRAPDPAGPPRHLPGLGRFPVPAAPHPAPRAAPCRSPSWPAPTRSMATRSSSPTETCLQGQGGGGGILVPAPNEYREHVS